VIRDNVGAVGRNLGIAGIAPVQPGNGDGILDGAGCRSFAGAKFLRQFGIVEKGCDLGPGKGETGPGVDRNRDPANTGRRIQRCDA
jgi:hypothetical protein